MLKYDRIDISEGTDVDKTNESREVREFDVNIKTNFLGNNLPKENT